MQALSVAVVVEDDALREGLKDALRTLPLRLVMEHRSLAGWQGLLDEIERVRPQVVLAGIAGMPGNLEEGIRALRAAPGAPTVMVVHAAAEPEAILAALRAGAAEFVFPPFASTLPKAFERCCSERRSACAPHEIGAILGFLSAKGGCGATTLACHFAAEMGRIASTRNQQVLLADLDAEVGLVGFLMKVKSSYSLFDAVQNLHRLDSSYWKALVSNGRPGLEVIIAGRRPAGVNSPALEQVQALFGFLRSQYRWIVLDLGRSVGSMAEQALPEVDELYLITMPDVPSLHQARQALKTVAERGYPKERLRLLLNRAPRPGAGPMPDEIERVLGTPLSGILPDEPAELDGCYCEGKLMPAASHLGRRIAQLAARAAGLPEEKPKQRFRLFR